MGIDLGTTHTVVAYADPVSYTHLDVYKRQIDDVSSSRTCLVYPLFLVLRLFMPCNIWILLLYASKVRS